MGGTGVLIYIKVMRTKMGFLCLCFLICETLNSQSLNCNLALSSLENANLFVAYNEYITNYHINYSIVLIDYVQQKDSISFFRVCASKNVFELFYKKPDYYFLDKTNIAYLYTKDYNHKKDTIWLKKVFQETRKLLKSPDIKVFWKNDSILFIEGYFVAEIYDPVIVEYQVLNKKIVKKDICEKMRYPDIDCPKGIKTFRNGITSE